MGVIANLQQTSVAPAVKRAAASLSSGFIAPAAGGRSADLADRQTAVVGKVESSIATQAASLSDAADKILAMPRVEPIRFQTMSPAEAVLRYAGDFIPSWAGAISIDLMPAVLVLILCVVHAAIRREGLPAVSASTMTAGELVAALQMAREVEDARRAVEEKPRADETFVLRPRSRKIPASRRLRPPTKTSPRYRLRVTPNSRQNNRHVDLLRLGNSVSCPGLPTIRMKPCCAGSSAASSRSPLPCLSADLVAMNGWTANSEPADAPAEIRQEPLLEQSPPSCRRYLRRCLPGGDKRLIPLRQPDGALAQPMTFELVGSGRLLATGTITPGVAQAFAAEVERRGDYIKTVVLNSPGGSVTDALAMGRLIRARDLRRKWRPEHIARRHARWCLPAASSGAPATAPSSACTRSRRSNRPPVNRRATR